VSVPLAMSRSRAYLRQRHRIRTVAGQNFDGIAALFESLQCLRRVITQLITETEPDRVVPRQGEP